MASAANTAEQIRMATNRTIHGTARYRRRYVSMRTLLTQLHWGQPTMSDSRCSRRKIGVGCFLSAARGAAFGDESEARRGSFGTSPQLIKENGLAAIAHVAHDAMPAGCRSFSLNKGMDQVEHVLSSPKLASPAQNRPSSTRFQTSQSNANCATPSYDIFGSAHWSSCRERASDRSCSGARAQFAWRELFRARRPTDRTNRCPRSRLG